MDAEEALSLEGERVGWVAVPVARELSRFCVWLGALALALEFEAASPLGTH